MNPEKLNQIPSHEIRAKSFMDGVQEIEGKILKAHDVMLSVMVNNALETYGKGYHSLDKMLTESGMDLSDFGDLAPAAIAERLDQETNSRSVVEVYASCDVRKPLLKFIKKTLKLAEKQGGRIDGNFMALSTDERENMISTSSLEFGFLTCNLFFTFDENLPGSI
ncbi:MAG: hypothetical protein MUP45_01810 [Candidatus Marinimicrobia bacterium]|nr:hypothetical protein [Candidatus Neomarinimicrobiota bacterium]